MASTGALLEEIAAMEIIQSEIAAISRRSDPERKRNLVQLRRQLSEKIGRVSIEGEKVFGALEDTGLASEFRSRLSQMRSAIALHQANWPAVTLDDANDDFLHSGHVARNAKDGFIQWTRITLSGLVR